MENQIPALIQASIDVKLKVLEDKALQKNIADAVQAVLKAFKDGQKVLFCGN